MSPDGLYCPAGDFFIDPWNPVTRAVITHSHSDHARPGSGTYLTASPGEKVLRYRLGSDGMRTEQQTESERVLHGVVSIGAHFDVCAPS